MSPLWFYLQLSGKALQNAASITFSMKLSHYMLWMVLLKSYWRARYLSWNCIPFLLYHTFPHGFCLLEYTKWGGLSMNWVCAAQRLSGERQALSSRKTASQIQELLSSYKVRAWKNCKFPPSQAFSWEGLPQTKPSGKLISAGIIGMRREWIILLYCCFFACLPSSPFLFVCLIWKVPAAHYPAFSGQLRSV